MPLLCQHCNTLGILLHHPIIYGRETRKILLASNRRILFDEHRYYLRIVAVRMELLHHQEL